jgi:hypothetical protein
VLTRLILILILIKSILVAKKRVRKVKRRIIYAALKGVVDESGGRHNFLVVFHITSVLFERLRFRRFTPIKFGLIL